MTSESARQNRLARRTTSALRIETARIRLKEAYTAHLTNSRLAEGRKDYFGVDVMAHSQDGSRHSVVITCKRGELYCCLELGCLLGLEENGWRRLRENLEDSGLRPTEPMRLMKVIVRIEKGARCALRIPGYDSELGEREAYAYEKGPFNEGDFVC